MSSTPSLSDKAYAAGFLDGEGNISIAVRQQLGCRGPVYRMSVMASQDDVAPLTWLCQRWGGSIVKKRTRANGKANHVWHCWSRQASVFLRDVSPFLQIKRTRAEVALEFQASIFQPGDGGHSYQYRSMLGEFYQKMKLLNREGKGRG